MIAATRLGAYPGKQSGSNEAGFPEGDVRKLSENKIGITRWPRVSGFMIAEAERRFPVRIRIGVPPDGLGPRLDRIKVWLDENCGANGWAMTPSGTRGVLNDALSVYFGDPTLASAFVARWCAGYSVETVGGVFQVREDESMPRVAATPHRTP